MNTEIKRQDAPVPIKRADADFIRSALEQLPRINEFARKKSVAEAEKKKADADAKPAKDKLEAWKKKTRDAYYSKGYDEVLDEAAIANDDKVFWSTMGKYVDAAGAVKKLEESMRLTEEYLKKVSLLVDEEQKLIDASAGSAARLTTLKAMANALYGSVMGDAQKLGIAIDTLATTRKDSVDFFLGWDEAGF